MMRQSDTETINQYIAEAARVLNTHQELATLLDALTKISAAQSTQTNIDGWDDLLAKKQLLMDAIDEIAPADLFGRTYLLEGALGKADRQDIAERLDASLEANRKRFGIISESEQLACTKLAAQVAEQRMALMNISRRQRARSSYRTRAEAPASQILDGVR